VDRDGLAAWPVGDPTNYTITPTAANPKGGHFGVKRKRSNGTTYTHGGTDIYASIGSPVFSVWDGKVYLASWQSANHHDGFGQRIVIKHTVCLLGGTVYTVYGHLAYIDVNQLQQVKESELIGFSGNTGNAWDLPEDRYHLHFEIHLGKTYPGTKIDPLSIPGGYH
jgi:murein DD-endopeptidase MepM/ murein hydrolase activator NlpD